MEAAPTCVYPVARTTPVPAPLASARSAAMPVPRVSGSGAPASMDVPCEGGGRSRDMSLKDCLLWGGARLLM